MVTGLGLTFQEADPALSSFISRRYQGGSDKSEVETEDETRECQTLITQRLREREVPINEEFRKIMKKMQKASVWKKEKSKKKEEDK